MGDLKMAFVNERTADGWRTVDRERNIFLKDVGGHENCRFFEMLILGQKIKFEASYRIEKIAEREAKITWEVERATIPDTINDRSFLRNVIYSSLDAYGFGHQKKEIKQFSVEFSKNISSLRV